MNHLKPHEVEGAKLHGAPKLHWLTAVKDADGRMRASTRCARYAIFYDTHGKALYASHYLLMLPLRHVMHVERSLEAAQAKVQAHHQAKCMAELMGLAE